MYAESSCPTQSYAPWQAKEDEEDAQRYGDAESSDSDGGRASLIKRSKVEKPEPKKPAKKRRGKR